MHRNFLVISILWCALLSSCTQSGNQLKDLRDKYTTETINYFYQTVFFEEFGVKATPARKWNDNIFWRIEGNLSREDIKDVHAVFDSLETMNLPIGFYKAEEADSVNMLIKFGSYEYLGIDKVNQGMVMTIRNDEYEIQKAEVMIPKDSSIKRTLRRTDRRKRIYEEIIQGLGAATDSFSHPESLFYQNINYPNLIAEIDKNVVRMLYEPSIEPGLTKERFEKEFSDLLYHCSISQKMELVAEKHDLSNDDLRFLHQYAFVGINESDGAYLMKYASPINIFLDGEVRDEFIEKTQNAIERLGSVSDNIRFQLVGIRESTHYEGLYLNFIHDENTEFVRVDHNETQVLESGQFRHRGRASVDITYKNHPNLNSVMEQVIINTIYRQISFTDLRDWTFFRENDTIQSNEQHLKLLKVYYDPLLYSGLKKSEFEECFVLLDSTLMDS